MRIIDEIHNGKRHHWCSAMCPNECVQVGSGQNDDRKVTDNITAYEEKHEA